MEQLKNHLYDIIGQKKTELDNFIKNIEIIKTDLINTAEAQIKVFDSAVENVANLADKYIDLISGDNTITVFFSPKQLSLNGLNAELFNLEGLDVDTPIAVDIVLNTDFVLFLDFRKQSVRSVAFFLERSRCQMRFEFAIRSYGGFVLHHPVVLCFLNVDVVCNDDIQCGIEIDEKRIRRAFCF